ncbi:hypothetical protein V6N11_010419 [Hibiscus sabdariffa]|uniref:Integrase zinc-binding domain-containing protein n=1 Tax=Hibiscus sabdariffa TaxID=183260 RepID=A0ABR2S588_9ROSI
MLVASIEIKCIDEEPNWMTPIVKFIVDGEELEDPKKRTKLRNKVTRYMLINMVLYRRSFFQQFLRCLGPNEANYVLREVHEGICEHHMGGWFLAQKVLHQGFYWSTINKDVLDIVTMCGTCKKYSPSPRHRYNHCKPSLLLGHLLHGE